MKHLAVTLALLLTNIALIAQPLEEVSPKSVGLSKEHLKYTDKVIETAIEKGHIPGAVLAVVRSGQLPYLKAYGDKSIFPRVESMKESTIFDIASCTKSVSTAISTMILLERGELSLQDDIGYYLPEFKDGINFEDKRRKIRIRHLLTHTSGIVSYVSVEQLKSLYDSVTIDSLLDYVANSELRFEPNSDFTYSCLNFIILQQIIERITGMSLSDFAQENIFDKLKMNNTGYLPLGDSHNRAWASKGDIAPTEIIEIDSTTHRVVRGVVHDPLAQIVNNGISGNAGVFSTAEDLAILSAMILNQGQHDGESILSPMTIQNMERIPEDITPLGRSLGWDVSSAYSSNMGDILSGSVIGHTGFTGPSITIDWKNDLAIILLMNPIHASKGSIVDIIRLRRLVANTVAASILPQSIDNDQSDSKSRRSKRHR